MGKLKQDTRPLGAAHTWARTPGTYIAGRAYIDGADETAAAMEAKWGVGRLRLLVSPELREKFDRQCYLFNQAIWHSDLEAVRREAGRMVKGWEALDRAAEAAGSVKLSPVVWEVRLENGSVAAIVRDLASAGWSSASKDDRRMVVYTLDEIGRMLSHWHEITAAKNALAQVGGATVEEVRKPQGNPLDALRDSDVGLDDELPDWGTKEIFA